MTTDVLDPTGALDPSIQHFISAALGRKAKDLVILDVRALTSFTDVFIICSGKSNRQVTAIAEHIKRDLKKNGISPISIEGLKDGQWVLMDYGNILIHIFLEPVREFYDLEGFWSNAAPVAIDDYVDMNQVNKTNGAAKL